MAFPDDQTLESYQDKKSYRGRFAPSPTGPLHIGSLIAALASYLDAKHHNGLWFIRIDDIDHHRCKPEHSIEILKTLETIGFEWDGDIIYQHNNLKRYQSGLTKLIKKQLTYPCTCSRKKLPPGPYPGTCRHKIQVTQQHSIRILTTGEIITLYDGLQGDYPQNLQDDVGDFIIHRADNMVSYHLATVIDDADAGITDIVRGSDLLDSTPRQIYLQRSLGLTSPAYFHFPVAVDKNGDKLSKQTHARAIETAQCPELLLEALIFLQQTPDSSLMDASSNEILEWAIKHWDRTKIPQLGSIKYIKQSLVIS